MHWQDLDPRFAGDPELLDSRHQPVAHEMSLTRIVVAFGKIEGGDALKIALTPSASPALPRPLLRTTG
jgi:hypothetical protein